MARNPKPFRKWRRKFIRDLMKTRPVTATIAEMRAKLPTINERETPARWGCP